MGERILYVGGKYLFPKFEITSNLWMLNTFEDVISFHVTRIIHQNNYNLFM